MIVLALDSTTRAGSVAVLNDTRVVDARAGDPSRSHAERLPAELTRVLAANGLDVANVGLFAVASGPGSFTGLRIGIATLQGLALARSRPLIGVSALEALAESAAERVGEGDYLGAWMDGHRRDVFTALYRRGSTGLVEVEGPSVGDPAATLRRWRSLATSPLLFVGGGAAMYARAIEDAQPGAVVEPAPLLAPVVARRALARFLRGDAPHPAALQPLYVRRPDAEVARDRANA